MKLRAKHLRLTVALALLVIFNYLIITGYSTGNPDGLLEVILYFCYIITFVLDVFLVLTTIGVLFFNDWEIEIKNPFKKEPDPRKEKLKEDLEQILDDLGTEHDAGFIRAYQAKKEIIEKLLIS